MAVAMAKVVTICATCAREGAAPEGAALRAALGDLDGWDVRMHDCLSVCDAPGALAVQAAGGATYVFGGVTLDDAVDLRAFLALYDAAPAGWIADARPAGRLRFCLKTRVPAV